MKIFDAEVAGTGKTRITFSIGYEEIDILHGLVVASLQHIPRIQDNEEQTQRMRNMQKVMSVYLGKSQPKRPKSSEYQCPKCNRKLRGERAVENHLRDVHGKDVTNDNG